MSAVPGASAYSSAKDDYALYASSCGQCRKHGVVVLLPIATRSSHFRPRPRGGARARARRVAPALLVNNFREGRAAPPTSSGALAKQEPRRTLQFTPAVRRRDQTPAFGPLFESSTRLRNHRACRPLSSPAKAGHRRALGGMSMIRQHNWRRPACAAISHAPMCRGLRSIRPGTQATAPAFLLLKGPSCPARC